MKQLRERSRVAHAVELRPFDGSRSAPRGTVVVIDEDPRSRADAAALLSSRGWRVRSTGDAAEGLECIRRSAPAVVVLGYSEGSHTLDLIRRLRGRFEPLPLPSPPRIVVLGEGLDEPRARFARRLGADAVLPGAHGSALTDAVHELSGGSQP